MKDRRIALWSVVSAWTALGLALLLQVVIVPALPVFYPVLLGVVALCVTLFGAHRLRSPDADARDPQRS